MDENSSSCPSCHIDTNTAAWRGAGVVGRRLTMARWMYQRITTNPAQMAGVPCLRLLGFPWRPSLRSSPTAVRSTTSLRSTRTSNRRTSERAFSSPLKPSVSERYLSRLGSEDPLGRAARWRQQPASWALPRRGHRHVEPRCERPVTARRAFRAAQTGVVHTSVPPRRAATASAPLTAANDGQARACAISHGCSTCRGTTCRIPGERLEDADRASGRGVEPGG